MDVRHGTFGRVAHQFRGSLVYALRVPPRLRFGKVIADDDSWFSIVASIGGLYWADALCSLWICDLQDWLQDGWRAAPGTRSVRASSATRGYNSRAFCWVGRARVEAIFDSGSTRNPVDEDYLRALLRNGHTGVCAKDVVISNR